MTVAGSDLRATLRARRRAIPLAEQAVAAASVMESLAPLLDTSPAGIAAAYVATDGEISPDQVIARLRRAGWQIAYPRIANDTMTFHLVEDESTLVLGPFQLLEPHQAAPVIGPSDLDIVLAPLVGFDARCHRLGRGKAYYDRAFAFLQTARRPTSPLLIGLAHDVQRVDALEQASHDVTLDAVVTPTATFGNFLPPM